MGDEVADIDDRLVPRDGLNSYNVALARVELMTGASAQFTFAVSSALLQVSELQVDVPVVGQSLDRMTVQAHDLLIDILRQLIFRADSARRHYERNASRQAPPPAAEAPEAPAPLLPFRLAKADPGFEKIDPAAEADTIF